MAIRAKRKQFAPWTAVTRPDVPTEAALGRNAFRRLHARHQPNGFRFEDAHAIKLPLIEHHARIAREVRGGEKKSSVAGHATHVPSGGIVYRPAQRHAVENFRRCDAVQFLFGRQKAGVLHVQRSVNLLLDEFFQRLAADSLHDFTEQKEIDITIPESGAWLGYELFLAGFADRRFLSLPIRSGFDVPAQP